MASPVSVVDVFFPGFSAINATAQQLLLHDVNGYVRFLCMGAVVAIFARYVYGYINDVIIRYFKPFKLITMMKRIKWLPTGYSSNHSLEKQLL
ncbi:hypothetical protein PISL3812_09766 [Talaromyces islandicus]|uniref:Uncharacterized protein n=1 Tax=Talaromyces islandicus TaxID=28573 RepID=A0A0U1MCH2_TALIS|nr:hypothetical protein PISL3812_09766 [Talaromyces islandicus]